MATVRKCDVCGKLLTNKDDYFTLDEVTFNKGKKNSLGVRLVISKDKSTTYELKESWCDYSDKHFCVEDFKKESIWRFYDR